MRFEATLTVDGLRLTGGERSHVFHPVWLRENSTDPEFRDAGTRLRIGQASAIPLDLSITSFALEDGQLDLVFSDAHECRFEASALLDRADAPRPDDLVGEQTYWDATLTDYPEYSLTELEHDDARLLHALLTVARYGFAVVRGLGVAEDALNGFAAVLGPMRETHWGRVTDVRNIANPYDLTMTARSLSPHVDNPYRLPGPGYILMHCLKNDTVGGESTLVDGFGAAATLRDTTPDAFEVLTTVAPNFRHAEASAVLEHSAPLIELNAAGNIARVRFSNRTEQVPALAPSTLTRYYAARKAFADLIFSPARTLTLKLQPGDGFIWDNYRILHGRTAFDAAGERHMRHCYLDRDTVSSRQKCLLRDIG